MHLIIIKKDFNLAIFLLAEGHFFSFWKSMAIFSRNEINFTQNRIEVFFSCYVFSRLRKKIGFSSPVPFSQICHNSSSNLTEESPLTSLIWGRCQFGEGCFFAEKNRLKIFSCLYTWKRDPSPICYPNVIAPSIYQLSSGWLRFVYISLSVLRLASGSIFKAIEPVLQHFPHLPL